MSDEYDPDPATAVAAAWQPRATRAALASLFALDRRLAGFVGRAREPLLAQVRLAWWRDRLGDLPQAAPAGEPLLASLAGHWGHRAPELRALADGWEHLLGDAPLQADAIDAYASAHGHALAAFADLAEAPQNAAAARAAGRGWALAGLASRSSISAERDIALSLGREQLFPPIRSRRLRGVAVLGGLARRALARDEPLMHGRGAAVEAARIGMFGG